MKEELRGESRKSCRQVLHPLICSLWWCNWRMVTESPRAADCWDSCQGCISGGLNCRQLLVIPAQDGFPPGSGHYPEGKVHRLTSHGRRWWIQTEVLHCKAALKHSPKMRTSARGAVADRSGCGICNSQSCLLIKCVSGLSVQPEVN